jgi:nitrate/nitrite transport system substrate-binding protein
MMNVLNPSTTRHKVLQAISSGTVGLSPALRPVIHAAGSDASEKTEVKIGFIPLADRASIVMMTHGLVATI